MGKLPRAEMTISQLRSEAAAAMNGLDDSPRALGIALRCIYETAVCAPDGTTTRLFRMRVPVHDADDAQVILVEIGAHAESMFVGRTGGGG